MGKDTAMEKLVLQYFCIYMHYIAYYGWKSDGTTFESIDPLCWNLGLHEGIAMPNS